MIGDLCFRCQEYETFEIAYDFNVAYENKGFASEAGKALVDSLFSVLNARRITLQAHVCGGRQRNKPRETSGTLGLPSGRTFFGGCVLQKGCGRQAGLYQQLLLCPSQTRVVVKISFTVSKAILGLRYSSTTPLLLWHLAREANHCPSSVTRQSANCHIKTPVISSSFM